MSKTVWPRQFPSGVADEAGQYALYRAREGRLAALRLDDGRVLWRSEAQLQPLLLGAGLALALAVSPPRVVALALEGANAGRPVWASPALPWPEWASGADAKSLQCDLEAAWLDADVGLHWTVRRVYSGGAPMGRSRPAGDVASGCCRLDAASGALLPLTDWPERGAEGAAASAGVDDPAVLAQHRLGARLYRLVARPAGGGVRTALVALDAATQAVRWEVILDEGPRRPAPALRP